MKPHLLVALLLAAAVISGASHAVTLGAARVNSFLNQPLDVEIDIVGLAPGQNEDLRLRIANDAQLERLGIVFDELLRDLRFDVVQAGGRWVVRARSDRPVSEPFLDFAVQMSWPGGQMIRQYTLLLDPPTRIRPARAASAGRAAPAPAREQPVGTPENVGGSYGPVRSGETLWPIAQRLKPSGITTRQMAIALLRANPQAFIDGNVNKLRAGATLSIPPRAVIEELDAAAARAEFAAQTRRWQAPAVATSPRVLEGEVSPPPEPAEPPAEAAEAPSSLPPPSPPESEDQLRIVTESEKPTLPPSATEQALREQLLVTMEEIESNRLTTSAMGERLSRLEGELQQMQKLIELKDAQIEALQAEVSARAAIQEAARLAEPAAPAAPQLPSSLALPGEAEGQTPAAPAPAPRTAVTVAGGVPIAAAGTTPPVRPWYETYLWAIWVTLGLLGLTALVLMWRRPRPAPVRETAADLPAFRTPAAAATGFGAAGAAGTAGSAALRKAEEDFRRLARERLGDDTAAAGSLGDLPDLETPADGADAALDDSAESLLDRVLDENKLLEKRPGPGSPAPDYSDDDIATWIKELGAEVDHVDEQSANDEALVDDDDIPSILNELDDQLGSRDSQATTPRIDLEPLDEAPDADDEVPDLLHEIDDQLASPGGPGAPTPADASAPASDDFAEQAFSMSLDLARAYLEIGDHEGARDMLQQALSRARDPDHRRQIEEMLKQID